MESTTGLLPGLDRSHPRAADAQLRHGRNGSPADRRGLPDHPGRLGDGGLPPRWCGAEPARGPAGRRVRQTPGAARRARARHDRLGDVRRGHDVRRLHRGPCPPGTAQHVHVPVLLADARRLPAQGAGHLGERCDRRHGPDRGPGAVADRLAAGRLGLQERLLDLRDRDRRAGRGVAPQHRRVEPAGARLGRRPRCAAPRRGPGGRPGRGELRPGLGLVRLPDADLDHPRRGAAGRVDRLLAEPS